MGYSTIPLEVSDRAQRDALVRMWTANLSDEGIAAVADARMTWLYEGNPLGAPRTFLSLHVEKNEIVGCGSTFPRNTWALGRVVKAGIPCDFAVMKNHRLGGAAIGLQRALVAGSRAAGFEFLFGFPNKMSLPIIKRVGYQVVADARAWVKPLRTAHKIRERVKSGRLARAAGVFVDAGLRAWDLARLRPRPRTWAREVLDRADARFDVLWERARDSYPIVGEKSSPYLNWRYARFTTRRYRFFCLTEKPTGALHGFVVFSIENEKAFVADVFSADLGETFDRLMLSFAAQMRKERRVSVYVSFVGKASFGGRLERLGFFRSADQERSLVVYVDKEVPKPFATALLDPNNWVMFDGEMDI